MIAELDDGCRKNQEEEAVKAARNAECEAKKVAAQKQVERGSVRERGSGRGCRGRGTGTRGRGQGREITYRSNCTAPP